MPDPNEHLPEWYQRPILVLGCGNDLLGDDGFGPAVAEELERRGYDTDGAFIMDAGSSAREIIFPLLLGPTSVERLVIIDAVDFSDKGRKPGEVFRIDIEEIPDLKVDNYSMHQIPTSNMLKDLKGGEKGAPCHGAAGSGYPDLARASMISPAIVRKGGGCVDGAVMSASRHGTCENTSDI
jgi:coenzyme F420 hydrogenase subunit delta